MRAIGAPASCTAVTSHCAPARLGRLDHGNSSGNLILPTEGMPGWAMFEDAKRRGGPVRWAYDQGSRQSSRQVLKEPPRPGCGPVVRPASSGKHHDPWRCVAEPKHWLADAQRQAANAVGMPLVMVSREVCTESRKSVWAGSRGPRHRQSRRRPEGVSHIWKDHYDLASRH
jgi:hypothetical protein